MNQINEKQSIAILGSTGSIGTQTLDVIDRHPGKFTVELLSANNNFSVLAGQIVKYQPNVAVIVDENHYDKLFDLCKGCDTKIYSGQNALVKCMEMDTIDTVIAAIVGYAGLAPVLAAIESGKKIALANKETLVVAGELVQKKCLEHKVSIIPIDSEHSAIFQCLCGEFKNPIEKIILTASGGPFRGKTRKELQNITKSQALKHPNWEMGAKITIDSASMMNKGLEVIEAKWLFDLGTDQIEIVVHPQSIVHSLVQFEDGSLKAQLGLPDMRLPIQFALSYPGRFKSDFERFSFENYPSLNFELPDRDTFKNLDLAYQALELGGNKPCILNAANEVAVDMFLKEKISFLGMSDLIEDCLYKIEMIKNPSLFELRQTDEETRTRALELAH